MACAGMHEELLRLEFEHYLGDDEEEIFGMDFAHSILSAVDLATIDTYLHRAASLPPELANFRVGCRSGIAECLCIWGSWGEM